MTDQAKPTPTPEPVVIKDKRKIDSSGKPRTPDTGGGQATVTEPTKQEPTTQEPAKQEPTVREKPAPMGQPGKTENVPTEEPAVVEGVPVETIEAKPVAPVANVAEVESLRSEAEERLRDLQRVTAEYANYRKRVERDRGVVAEQAVGTVVSALLPILDDLDRAKEHGDLTGPFGSVAEQLTGALGKFGVTAFGEPGDGFDPTRHEAVAHQTSADVKEPTCVGIMRRGYLLGERLLRPALVAVADPE